MKVKPIKIDWEALKREGEQLAKVKPIEKQTLTNTERKVLSIIVANPGIIFSQICDSLGISSAISVSLRNMINRGLIYKIRKGQNVFYYPNRKERKK